MNSFTNSQGVVGIVITNFDGLDLKSVDRLLYIVRMAILLNSLGVKPVFFEEHIPHLLQRTATLVDCEFLIHINMKSAENPLSRLNNQLRIYLIKHLKLF